MSFHHSDKVTKSLFHYHVVVVVVTVTVIVTVTVVFNVEKVTTLLNKLEVFLRL